MQSVENFKLSEKVVGRLAPTPSGSLHLGNARTFLIAWLAARSCGGEVRLRIDDLDRPRVKPGYVEQAVDDLRWLGLDWDGEPVFQSRRDDAYREALRRLCAAGLVYPCVCSRRDIESAARAPHLGEEGTVYPGTCRGKFQSADEALRATRRHACWRFETKAAGPVEFDDEFHGRCVYDVSKDQGDFIVMRNDGIAAYQLATVVDDHEQGVTHVVRGDDLLASTPRQLLLYRALGWHSPRFLHVPIVLDATGQRMAKRRDSTCLAALRDSGVSAASVIGLLAASCGWSEQGENLSPHDLLARYDLRKLPATCVRLG